jgi:ABC-type bacteriocin/lantibiotic exporter with double-glycine peptidase domain
MAPIKHHIEIHVREIPGNCGAAAVKMIFGRYGINLSERHLQRALGTDPQFLGTSAERIVDCFRMRGLQAEILDNCAFEDLEDRIHGKNGHGARPVIINWWQDTSSYGHYSVVCDIQEFEGETCVVLADPSYKRHRWYTKDRLLQLWFDYHGFYPEKKDDFIFRRMIDVWKE